MKSIKIYILAVIAILISATYLHAASIKGVVYGYDVNQNKTPLIGATVMW